MSEDSNSIVEQACAGDRVALERLLISHADQLTAHIARGVPTRVQRQVAVEDVVQDTLTQAFLKIHRLREKTPRAFAAWLLAIGDMTLIDVVRRETAQARGGQLRRRELTNNSVTGSVMDLLENLPGEAATASRIVAREEGIAALQVAIAGLPDDQRQAVQLHLLQGKTLRETSVAMQRTTAAIRSLVHRAKHNLAQAMGRASLWLSQR